MHDLGTLSSSIGPVATVRKVVVVTHWVTAGGHVAFSTKYSGHEPVFCAFALAFRFTFDIATFVLSLEFEELIVISSTDVYPLSVLSLKSFHMLQMALGIKSKKGSFKVAFEASVSKEHACRE